MLRTEIKLQKNLKLNRLKNSRKKSLKGKNGVCKSVPYGSNRDRLAGRNVTKFILKRTSVLT